MLRGRPLGEADRIMTLFTTENGKTDAVAKGARRARSHLSGRLEFGNECDFQMHKGRSLDVIVSAEIVSSPWQSLVEPDRYATAHLVAELVDAFCEPELAVPEVYALLSAMLGAIAATDHPKSLIPRFSLRLLAALGLEPPVEACIHCNLAFEDDVAFLDSQMGGFSCRKDHQAWRDTIELDGADLKNLRELAMRKGERGAALYARPRVADAIEGLISHHLGRRPKAAI